MIWYTEPLCCMVPDTDGSRGVFLSSSGGLSCPGCISCHTKHHLGTLRFVPTVPAYKKGSLFSLRARVQSFGGRVGMKPFIH